MKKLDKIIESTMKKYIKEGLYDEWYDQEDYDGNTGKEGEVKSYDIGTYYIEQAEQDAKEMGYDDVADYLQYWFDEIQYDCPWYWQKIGSGYGYNGETIFKNGGIVCKDIYGQIMIDEYPLSAPSMHESKFRKMVRENVAKTMKKYIKESSELDYDLDQFKKAMQKSNGTYSAKSSNGKFKTGDRVIVQLKNGNTIEGWIEDFGTNIMTWDEDADIKYMENGRSRTLIGVPLDKLEKVK